MSPKTVLPVCLRAMGNWSRLLLVKNQTCETFGVENGPPHGTSRRLEAKQQLLVKLRFMPTTLRMEMFNCKPQSLLLPEYSHSLLKQILLNKLLLISAYVLTHFLFVTHPNSQTSETDLQAGLEEMYANMSGETFRSMRRTLPVKRTLMEWNVNAIRMNRQVRK
jgi:hypothetical protein